MEWHASIAGLTAARWARRLPLVALVPAFVACSALREPRAPTPPAEEVFLLEERLAVRSEAPPEPPEEPPTMEPAADSAYQPPPPDNVLEDTRRGLRSTTEWLARGIDSWFGDKPFYEGGEITNARVTIGFFKRQGEGLDTRLRFNARVRLPNVEERAYLFIGRDNEREVVEDTPAAFSRQERLLAETREDRSFFTGLGFALREAFDLRLGFHGIKPYAQARYHRPWRLTARDLVEFRQTFFWRISQRFGSTTAASYEHALGPDTAFRWLAAATVTQKSEKFDWSNIFGAYKVFGYEELLSTELIFSGRVHSGVNIGEYGVQVKWQEPIYSNWLIGEFLLGYYWPRFDNVTERTQRWGLGIATTLRF